MTTTPRRRLFLMRHGSVTYFDASGRPYPPETVPLNDEGRAQADAAGHAFAAAGVRFDRVIVSGLPRTVETAARVLAATRGRYRPGDRARGVAGIGRDPRRAPVGHSAR
jgi:broad specificity phosphatase PhoE